jgi:Dolichyl-phosphate-mannose-protein mannosyltransferase
MPSGEFIQNLIHKLETGTGARYQRIILLVVALFALGFCYDLRAYRNFAAPEAMDSAQLARNISEGKGYTTLFIRPLSLYLVQKHNEAEAKDAKVNAGTDFAEIKTAHPDLANPPVYPVLLAGLMKILPFHYPVNVDSSFWGNNGHFWRYEPDFLIAIFNQILLLVVVVLTFSIGRKLFDDGVAWLSALLVLGSALLWQFSSSGLSTMLLLVIFMGLTWCVLRTEEIAREPEVKPGNLLWMAVAAGLLTGIGALTRYSFGWLIIPVTLFQFFFSGQRRVTHSLAAFGAFVLVLTPWIVRNEMVSGTAFGTAGFAVLEGTFTFPDFKLQRSLHPDFSNAYWLSPYVHKLFGNMQTIFQDGLPKLGGSWASMFFLVGLMLNFRSAASRRVRYFLLMSLGLFIVVQALGQTQLSVETPEVNSENLLVLLAPLVFIYGTALFFTLLEQITLQVAELRYVIIGIFTVLCCLPMIFAVLSPKNSPVVYPPYFPPDIQKVSNWMKPNELMMSDVPWAVAWYGQRQCVWLTLNAQSEFFAINDSLKPVQALYLTPKTMNGKFVSDWMDSDKDSWGRFVLEAITKNKIPADFPLHHAPTGFLPDRLFLTDWNRWQTGLAPDTKP